MTPIAAVLAAIESLGPRKQLSYKRISKIYGCDRTTLIQRYQHQSVPRSLEAQNRQALHPQQEQELLRYIKRLTKQGLPPTRAMMRNFGSQIAKRELGEHWVDRLFSDILTSSSQSGRRI